MRSRVLTSRLREQFVVTKKNGESFIGILYSFDKHVLVLKQAEAVGAGENKTNIPIDGEILVMFADVDHMQRP